MCARSVQVRVPLNALGLGVEQLQDLLLSDAASGRHSSGSDLILHNTSSTDTITCLQLVGIIRDQVATVARILNDVLSFQRIEEGELALEFSEFSVPSMIANTLHSFQSEFRAKALTVSVHFLPPAAVDEHPDGDGDGDAERLDDHDYLNQKQSHIQNENGEHVEWRVVGDQYRLRQVLRYNNTTDFSIATLASISGQPSQSVS